MDVTGCRFIWASGFLAVQHFTLRPIQPGQVFRSFGEDKASETSVLAGTRLCWTGFCIMGLTLDELTGLARAKTRRRVIVLRDMNAEEFREHLKSSNDTAHRYIINFDRKMIFGAGGGHHSPIGWISRRSGPGLRAGRQSQLPSMACAALALVRCNEYVGWR
jgi:Phytochelatin synthase